MTIFPGAFRSDDRAGPGIAIVLAALSVTQLLGWGATFWLPAVTGKAMADELALPLALVMAGPTMMLVVMAVTSWPLATAFPLYGARPIMTAGSALGAVGLLIMSMACGPVSYLLAWAVLGLAGACMLTTPAQIAVTEVAGEKSRQALSILILAGGLTSTIMWPLTGILQAALGWRATTLIYAGLLLAVCLPLHWCALRRRTGNADKTKAAPGSGTIDRRQFVLLATSFAANGFFTWGFALTIIILFEARGLDHAAALTAAALIGIAQWAGRMVDMVAGRRWSGLTIGLIGAALFPLSFVVLMTKGGFAGAVLFALLYGIASGITAVARATLPLQLFAPGDYARAAARMSVPLNFAFATAPPAFTALMTSASPQATLWLAFVISVFALAMLLALSLVHRRSGERLSET